MKNSKHPVLEAFDKLTVAQWLGIICGTISFWMILILIILAAKVFS